MTRILHKLLKPIRAMAHDTSKFNIKVESKVNLISVLSVYEYLLKKTVYLGVKEYVR